MDRHNTKKSEQKMNQEMLHKLFVYKNGRLYWKVSNTNRIKVGDIAGYITEHGYRKIRVEKKQEYEHRIVFLMHHGFLPKHLDHIDGNKLNNKIENLREATHSQNMMNVKIKKNNTSGTKGVCFDKQRKKWLVRITIQNKDIHLGRFDDLELAELVAIEGRDKYHKSFARLF
jgi:hypothetical protein